MLSTFVQKCVLVSTILSGCHCAKILGIIPTASYSHQITFHPLWRELAMRGHQVTVVTTDPLRNTSIPNFREVDLSEVHVYFKDVQFYETISGDIKYFWNIAFFLRKVTLDLTKLLLENSDIQKLTNETFDLVIGEAHFPSILGLIGHFRCPWIGVSSMESGIQFNVAIGNPAHPVLNPDYNLPLGNLEDLNFLERITSSVYRIGFVFLIDAYLYPSLSRVYEDAGLNTPPLIDIQNNISMLFVTTHPIFHNLRPVFPNTISIGTGMHFQQRKPLPKDLQTFLDEGEKGVIYFSLGSNINLNLLTDNFKKAIVEAFAEVPYKVLLKMDGQLNNVSKNVLVRKWMPQQDIFRHKNIKLFITQGGLQSLQEAVLNEIPLIGIPFFGDQFSNVNKMVKKGYGLKIDRTTITKNALVTAIKEVIQEPKYTETAQMMGKIFRDEEIPSLQRAVYWTEYVIRHKGAKHLRSPTVDMPAWKYYMLDVVGFLAFISLLIIVLIYLLIKVFIRLVIYIFARLFGKRKPKIKKN